MNERAREIACMYDPESPEHFYRDVFPDGSLDIERRGGEWKDRNGRAYCGIMVGIPLPSASPNKHHIRRMITDDFGIIDEIVHNLRNDYFCITSPITYAGMARRGDMAHAIYGLAIDVDYVHDQRTADGYAKWLQVMEHQWRVSNIIPQPTYLVASGNGVHVYYLFADPLPAYRSVTEPLGHYKRWITDMLWSADIVRCPRTADGRRRPQIGSIWQGFRMPGSLTKAGDDVIAFRCGPKISIDQLNSFLPKKERERSTIPTAHEKYVDGNDKKTTPLAEAKVLWPDWYENRIVKKEEPSTEKWTAHQGLYEWWRDTIHEEAAVGHRYYCLLYLVAYALKCDVPFETVEADCRELQPIFELRTPPGDDGNHFTEKDVLDALKAYHSSPWIAKSRIETIERRTGISIPRNRRNGRKQKDHLRVARKMLEVKRELGEVQDGRPAGKSKQRDLITAWRCEHPNGKPAECTRDTGISRSTVYRWWNKRD